MIDRTNAFIDELRSLLSKHQLIVSANDKYDKNDNYCGQSFEIKGAIFHGDGQYVYFDSPEALIRLVHNVA